MGTAFFQSPMFLIVINGFHFAAVIVTGGLLYCALVFPFASFFGKLLKGHGNGDNGKLVDPYQVEDMKGRMLGMNFLVADLNHNAEASRPNKGDALIILETCGMGMTIARDRRGNFLSGFSTPQENMTVADQKYARAYDSFSVHVNGEGDTTFKRYQIRPCGLARRTWVVVL